MISGPHPLIRPWIKPSWLPKIAYDDPPEGLELPCRLWLGARNDDGYPVARIGKKLVYVHRYALEQHLGEALGEDEADHQCNRRNCFEESHLERMSHAANMARSQNMLVRASVTCLSPEDMAALADWHWVLIARRYA